jgi:uncharacterized protein (TIGR04255 family)
MERLLPPKKLKKDTIVEALFEIRFSSVALSEVVVGQLCNNPQWQGFEQVRLSAAEIPPRVRENDTNLRFQPLIELKNKELSTNVRVGDSVISIHRLVPYSGWDDFKEYIASTLSYLESTLNGLKYLRLGLRYVNLINRRAHSIASIEQLFLKLNVGSEDITDNFHVVYHKAIDKDLSAQIRFATPSYLSGPKLPNETLCAIDIDMFTPSDFEINTSGKGILDWLEVAHDHEKQIFFSFFSNRWLQEMKA